MGEGFSVGGVEEGADRDALVAHADGHGESAEILHLLNFEARPLRVEADLLGPTSGRKPADYQGVAGDFHLFVGARGAVVELEGEPDRQEIEADEAQNRPSAERPEIEAGHEPYAADEKHKENKGF